MIRSKLTDNNFIVNFKAEELRQVRRDIELFREGYLFYYAVDTYDVINHYLPYTDQTILSGSNRNAIAQRAIAYEKFFTDSQSDKLVVLKEYQVELDAAKSYIERQIKNSSLLNANIDQLKVEISKIRQANKETIRKNIELILLLLILSENKGNVAKNFFEFVQQKLSRQIFQTGNDERDELLEHVFDNSVPSKNVDEVYDLFVEKTVYYLSKLDSDIERYTYLENSYRDIEVIDRIQSVNLMMHRDHAKEKIVFIYLSSAPYKSVELINLFQKVNGIDLRRDDPFTSFSFHRNIYQCFLYKILIEEFPNKEPTPFLIIDSLIRMVEQINNFTESDFTSEENEHLDILQQLLDRYSSNIDNHFYFKIYNKYQAVLNLGLSESDDQIVSIIKTLNGYLQREKILNEGKDIFYNISQYKLTYLLSKVLSNDPSVLSLHIQFGKDIVRDSFHHLPYLLLIDEPHDSELSHRLHELLCLISNIPSATTSDIKEIIPHLKEIIREVSQDQNSSATISIGFLLTAYLYLVADIQNTSPKKQLHVDKEKEILDILKKQKKMLEDTFIQFLRSDSEDKLIVQKKPVQFIKEFDYVILWLMRRNRFLNDAINFGNELVSTYDDPRFAQGLGLSYVSQAYELLLADSTPENVSDSIMVYFENGLLWMKKAKESFSALSGSLQDSCAVDLMVKNIMAACNSIADSSIRKFSMGKLQEDSLLKEAREQIQEIKTFCPCIGTDYSNLPIYNFTEAELEYYEALFAYNQGQINTAYLKILEATKRYAIANSTESSMHGMFKGIEQNIMDLRNQILKEKKVLH